jgi:hypothetical protein
MANDTLKKVGVWAFMVGIVLAIIAGVLASNLANYMGTISVTMAVLGIIVGMLNVDEKEVTGFIIAAIGLATGATVIANLGGIVGGTIGSMVRTAFSVFGVFVAGAVFIPAIKAIIKIAKN